MLLTAPVDKTEKELPSPEKLRRKIILKHKKLPEGSDENAGVILDLDSSKETFSVLPFYENLDPYSLDSLEQDHYQGYESGSRKKNKPIPLKTIPVVYHQQQ